MARPSQIVLLVEDERHERFVRRYLYRLGFSRHDIRVEDLPSGRGCGEQWVRVRYPAAVRAYRQRSSRAKTALVVAIDADTATVDRRSRQLQDALVSENLPDRGNREAIAHLIPKRSIETWILCLSELHVDEDTDYRQARKVDELIVPAAGKFFEASRPNTTPSAHYVPSLLAAIPEMNRLE